MFNNSNSISNNFAGPSSLSTPTAMFPGFPSSFPPTPNTPSQPQPAGAAAWEGDTMLHLYLCDYLRKRGYSQAALALRLEAGIDPERKVPIDAPQSLLFEWWVVFWEVFASRSTPNTLPMDSAGPATITDAKLYALSQQQQQQQRNSPPQQLMRQASQQQQQRQAQQTQAPSQKQPQQTQSSKGPDLEASALLGLARPASRMLIQQCMDTMSLGLSSSSGARPLESLTADEKQALAKRVSRLQAAQGEAQMRLAQLHGLGQASQPPQQHSTKAAPPPSVLSPAAGQAQGVKRKTSPNIDAGGRQPQGIGGGQVPFLRRMSIPVSGTSPIGMAMQYSPSSMGANTSPASMPPPSMASRRPSVLDSEMASSPYMISVGMPQQHHMLDLPTGRPISSPSPHIPCQRPTCTAPPPPQQPQRPVTFPSALDATGGGGGTFYTHAPGSAPPPGMPGRPLEASVFGVAEGGIGAMGPAGAMSGLMGGIERPNGTLVPFGELEHDFNVLLSNSSQRLNG